jgi:hypothetical protein
VTIALFDLGKPGLLSEMGASANENNAPATKTPDPPEPDDFQEKMDRIKKDGIPVSGISRMKRWNKTHKKVKPVADPHPPHQSM